eukprot:3616816-Rhodomonas_salina.2
MVVLTCAYVSTDVCVWWCQLAASRLLGRAMAACEGGKGEEKGEGEEKKAKKGAKEKETPGAFARMLCRVRYRDNASYAMSGTEIGYGRRVEGGARSMWRRLCGTLSAYAYAMRCPVLSERISLRACYAMSGTELASGRGCARSWYGSRISLRACYAMSGTDIAYGSVSLCACYAMSGTELAYGAMAGWGGARRGVAGACHVVSGTDLLHGVATRYAMSGTDIPCGATPYKMSSTDIGHSVVLSALRDVRY